MYDWFYFQIDSVTAAATTTANKKKKTICFFPLHIFHVIGAYSCTLDSYELQYTCTNTRTHRI